MPLPVAGYYCKVTEFSNGEEYRSELQPIPGFEHLYPRDANAFSKARPSMIKTDRSIYKEKPQHSPPGMRNDRSFLLHTC
jgi:hypothetical protein